MVEIFKNFSISHMTTEVNITAVTNMVQQNQCKAVVALRSKTFCWDKLLNAAFYTAQYMALKHQLHSSTIKQRKTKLTSWQWTVLDQSFFFRDWSVFSASIHGSVVIILQYKTHSYFIMSFSSPKEQFLALGPPFHWFGHITAWWQATFSGLFLPRTTASVEQ